MPVSERLHAAILFPSVLAIFVVQPLLAILRVPSEGLLFPLAAALVASIWSLAQGTRWPRLALALGAGVLAGAVGHHLAPGHGMRWLGLACLIALSTTSVALGVRWLFGASQITARTLLSAVSVYLLIAVTFTLVYVVIYFLHPTSFSGLSPAGHSAEVAELLYYSLGCLSTSAFGEILPTHPITRVLANAESVMGQLYMAVLVAILITGYASPSNEA